MILRIHSRKLLRGLQIALCVLVFFFAFHAKTAAYDGNTVAKLAPSVSSKLWVKAQESKVQTANPPLIVLFTLGLFLLQTLCPKPRSVAAVRAESHVISSGFLSFRDPRLFFRPPPIL